VKIHSKNVAGSARLSGTFVYLGETGDILPVASSSKSRANANLMNGQLAHSTWIVDRRSNMDRTPFLAFQCHSVLIKIERFAQHREYSTTKYPSRRVWETSWHCRHFGRVTPH